MESTQRIGAFKARGAFSALTHLASPPPPDNPASDKDVVGTGIGLPTLRNRGVVTHSSGNHAQALALAASTLNVPATIVMPTISTSSKISGTKNTPGVRVVFSGSTSEEREEVVRGVIEEGKQNGKRDGRGEGEGAILVPPYDHVDIILGQGTVGLEMERQFSQMKQAEEMSARKGRGKKEVCSFASGATNGDTEDQEGLEAGGANGVTNTNTNSEKNNLKATPPPRFDAVITPLGGGGLLSGVATWFSHTRDAASSSTTNNLTTTTTTTPQKQTLIFGAEPSHQSANDGERGLSSSPPVRIPHVSSLTIADGLRTPVGLLPWTIISDRTKVCGVYSVSELEIKMALKLVMERMKVVVEPSAAVPLAVVLFCRGFREFVAREQQREMREVGGDGQKEVRPWDVGVVFSGGNTTLEALSGLFGEGWMDEQEVEQERAAGVVGVDGKRVAEDVAG